MNELVKSNIENLIYEVRGVQVMLDSDLARLYQCKNGTKTINQAVNRHKERFPNDFYFKLNEEEYKSLRSQVGTLEEGKGKHKKYLPYVFTEQGVSMIATVLRTDVAATMSIRIMRAFVAMRHYVKNNLVEQSYINRELFKNIENHDNRLKLIEDTLDNFKSDIKVNQVFYNGQIYDAYSCIVDIMNKGKSSVIVIDNYTDKSVLDMISKVKCNVTLITKSKTLISKLDLEKYYEQYDNLEVIYNNDFHDRFIILDKSIIYHLGSSINHAGNKVFAINKIEESGIIECLLQYINRTIT